MMQEYKLLKIISEIKQLSPPSYPVEMGEFSNIPDPLPNEKFLDWLRRVGMPPVWAEKRKGRNGNSYFSTKIKIWKFINEDKFKQYLDSLPGKDFNTRKKYCARTAKVIADTLQSYFNDKFGEGKFKVVVTNGVAIYNYIPNIRIYTQERPKHTKMTP
jgi:hypothetical protein